MAQDSRLTTSALSLSSLFAFSVHHPLLRGPLFFHLSLFSLSLAAVSPPLCRILERTSPNTSGQNRNIRGPSCRSAAPAPAHRALR
jgi:hypothetical protein